MSDPTLAGDADGLFMACPAGPAAELATQLTAMSPSGPVLELCCGVGGLTRELARAGREVLAVDISLERLRANRANLAAVGLEHRVSHLCCDLRRPAFSTVAGTMPFAASVLDPDWSPPGQTPDKWTSRLADMDPQADALISLGLSISPLVVVRLPRDIKSTRLESNTGLACSELGAGGRRWRWMALQKPPE